MRGQCHKSKYNRRIEVNHNLNRLRYKAKKKLLSEQGIYHRGKRPIETEAVFGQIKYNNKFNRFTLRGLEKIDIEFGLVAISHNLRKLIARIMSNSEKNTCFCAYIFVLRVKNSFLTHKWNTKIYFQDKYKIVA